MQAAELVPGLAALSPAHVTIMLKPVAGKLEVTQESGNVLQFCFLSIQKPGCRQGVY
jgi:hypothetical protein